MRFFEDRNGLLRLLELLIDAQMTVVIVYIAVDANFRTPGDDARQQRWMATKHDGRNEEGGRGMIGCQAVDDSVQCMPGARFGEAKASEYRSQAASKVARALGLNRE